jgi:hypothetical protein
MTRQFLGIALAALMLPAGAALAQDAHPMMDALAQRVIDKYQSSSCQQLAQQRAEKKAHPATGPRAAMEARVIQMMRNDPSMRTEFLNRVAGPIANKMFECGMIP